MATPLPTIDTTSADFQLGHLTPDMAGYNPNIPIADIKPANPLDIKNPVPPLNTSDATVAGADQLTKDTNSYLTAINTTPKTPDEIKAEGLTTDLTTLYGAEAGKAADKTAAENAANIPQLNKDLASLNGEIATRTAEYKNLATQREGRAVTMNTIVGEEAQIQKSMASEIGLLSAKVLALQGNITAAEAAVTKAIDDKYAVTDEQIKIKEAQLELLKPSLTKSEKAKADALQLALDDKKTKIAEEKAKLKEWENSVNTALFNKAPLVTANQARALFNAGREDEARALLAPFVGPATYGTGGGATFTNTQINSGASNAGLSIAQFNKLSPDDKNFWVNNTQKDIAAKTKLIDTDINDGRDPNDIADEILKSNAPTSVKTTLTKHLWDQVQAAQGQPGGKIFGIF